MNEEEHGRPEEAGELVARRRVEGEQFVIGIGEPRLEALPEAVERPRGIAEGNRGHSGDRRSGQVAHVAEELREHAIHGGKGDAGDVEEKEDEQRQRP